MSGLYADDILEEIARANDIVDVVSGYFPLKRAGKDYKALCPFHAEKTPSFTVSPSKQIFKCFGCGRGGNVFNFVMAKESVTFPEAVRILAERAGIEVQTRPEAKARSSERKRLREVLDWAVRFFRGALGHPKVGQPARAYLEGRGFTAETIAAFQMGFAPDGWDVLLKGAERDGIPASLLEKAGLVVARDDGSGYYDRFRGRVIFTILDALRRPIGFGGRTLGDAEPKYLNSPETALFHKSENLYGLPQARDGIEAERRVCVVEGYTDVAMAHQVGVTNVVATLGTALTADHVRVLSRYADEVVLVFDSDLAGRRAADRGMELFLAADVRVCVTALPEGTDPFDVCLGQGADAFRALVDGAAEAIEYKWSLVRKECGAATSPAARRRALEAMLGSLAQAPALASVESSVRRDLVLAHISGVLGISEQALRRELARLRRRAQRDETGDEGAGATPASRGRRWAAERELMTALVCLPSRAVETANTVPPASVEDKRFRRLYETLVASPVRRDWDVENVTRRMEDGGLASLAVELYDRGEAVEACRDETDTGAGPVARTLEGAVAALKAMEDDAELAARSRAARETTDDTRALQEFLEARKQNQGFMPPAAHRRGTANP